MHVDFLQSNTRQYMIFSQWSSSVFFNLLRSSYLITTCVTKMCYLIICLNEIGKQSTNAHVIYYKVTNLLLKHLSERKIQHLSCVYFNIYNGVGLLQLRITFVIVLPFTGNTRKWLLSIRIVRGCWKVGLFKKVNLPRHHTG